VRGLFFYPDAVLCVPHGWALPPFRNIGASLFWRRCGSWGLDSRSRGPLHPQIPLCRSKAQGGTTYCRAIVTRTSGQTRTGAILRLRLVPRRASARNGRLPGLFGAVRVLIADRRERLLDDLKNLAHLLERHVELFLNATYRFGVLSVQSKVHESGSGKFPLGPGLKFTEQKSQMEHP
jgi:hypothetical protein